MGKQHTISKAGPSARIRLDAVWAITVRCLPAQQLGHHRDSRSLLFFSIPYVHRNKRTRNPILAEDKTPDVALDKYNIRLISAEIPYVAPQNTQL